MALLRRDAVFGMLSIAIAATGLGAVIAHPIESQADRLMSPVWVLLALGLPLLVGRRSGAVVEQGQQDQQGEQEQKTAFVSSDAA